MKNLLLAICIFGTLNMVGAASSPAANLPWAGAYELGQADACKMSCRKDADACRGLCTDPEEQEQCIVDCDRATCKESCDKFEDACKQRCQSSGG